MNLNPNGGCVCRCTPRIRVRFFGRGFQKCRVKDVEVESNFTRAVQFCKGELGLVTLPFQFTRLLMQWATDNPAQLKKACAIFHIFGLWEAALIKALIEDGLNLARWFLKQPGPPPVGGFA